MIGHGTNEKLEYYLYFCISTSIKYECRNISMLALEHSIPIEPGAGRGVQPWPGPGGGLQLPPPGGQLPARRPGAVQGEGVGGE